MTKTRQGSEISEVDAANVFFGGFLIVAGTMLATFIIWGMRAFLLVFAVYLVFIGFCATYGLLKRN